MLPDRRGVGAWCAEGNCLRRRLVRGGVVIESGVCLTQQGERPGLEQRCSELVKGVSCLLRKDDGLTGVTGG